MIKLSHFAITRLSSKASEKLSKLVMSKQWLPPEIYHEEIFTQQMDVWSLGLVFVFSLNEGKNAFGKDRDERIHNIRNKKTFTIQQLKDVDEGVQVYNLICSMISFNPEERPSASAVLAHTFFNQASPVVTENDDVVFVRQSPKRSLDWSNSMPPLEPINSEVPSKKMRLNEPEPQHPLPPSTPVPETISRRLRHTSITSPVNYSPTSTSLIDPTSPFTVQAPPLTTVGQPSPHSTPAPPLSHREILRLVTSVELISRVCVFNCNFDFISAVIKEFLKSRGKKHQFYYNLLR